jgi:hypothetical protein
MNDQDTQQPASIPDGTHLVLLDFSESEDTARFSDALNEFLVELSRQLDLSLLDGVTVTWDLAAGFRSIERGMDAPDISFTDNEQFRCVAKVVPVTRNDTPKIHVVYNAPFVVSLADPDSPHHLEARQILAHECGHVAEKRLYLDAFPERGLDRGYRDTVDALLLGTAEVMWSEYAACRLTAHYGDPNQLKRRYAQSLCDVSNVAFQKANPAIDDFRLDRNVDRLLHRAGAHICEPLRMLGYLHGHLDGTADSMPIAELCPNLPPAYSSLWDAARKGLRQVWDTRKAWANYDTTFRDLRNVAEAAMNAADIHFQPMQDGRTYVYVK